ncbi:MAG: hypothetical protein OEZ68_08715 [Gammaproteobacteria bacterium]|nr:hypothetical protein [Gammaproteobacteria bacterium]MDH5800868.1 hypothetical protein [Gammaproteobacteria bacterium]
MRFVWIFSFLGISIVVSSLVLLKRDPLPPVIVPEKVSEMEQALISEIFEQEDIAPVVINEPRSQADSEEVTGSTSPGDMDLSQSEELAQGKQVVLLAVPPEGKSFDADVASDAEVSLNEVAIGMTAGEDSGIGAATVANPAEAGFAEDLANEETLEDLQAFEHFSSGALGGSFADSEVPLASVTAKPAAKRKKHITATVVSPNSSKPEKQVAVQKLSQTKPVLSERPQQGKPPAAQKTDRQNKPTTTKPRNKTIALKSDKNARTLPQAHLAQVKSTPKAQDSSNPESQSDPESQVIAGLKQSILDAGRIAQPQTSKVNSEEEAIVVIVHKNNHETLSKSDIRNIYTDKVSRWSNGKKVTIFDLPMHSPGREVFSNTVLNMTSLEAATAASNRKITNQMRNIHKTKKDRLVASFVSRNESAIGYVSLKSVQGNSKVRIVYTIAE